MKKDPSLPKGYTEYKDKTGKTRLRYRETIEGKRHTLNCEYDPRTHIHEAAAEVFEWRDSIYHPDKYSKISLPNFVKKFTLKDKFAYALEQYVLFYMNVDKKKRERRDQIKRPASETVRVAKDTIRLIAKYPIGQTRLCDLTEDMIQDFLFDVADKYTYTRSGVEYRYGSNTCNKLFILIKDFMKEMGWAKVLFSNVKKGTADDFNAYHIKAEEHEDVILSPEERERYIKALFSRYKSGKRILGEDTADAAYVMLDGALRPAEVRGLQKKDYNKEDKSLYIVRSIPRGERKIPKTTKTDNKEKVFLTDNAAYIVEKHIKSCINNNDYIFKTTQRGKPGEYQINSLNVKQHMPLSYRSLYETVKRAAKRAEIDGKSVYPYTERHTTITDAYDGENDIFTAQQVARHKNSTTTSRYYVHPKKDLAEKARNRRNQQEQKPNYIY